MTYVILLIIVSAITGFLITYLLASRYSILERSGYGIAIGLGLYTWIVYLFSLLWGLQFKCIYIAAILLAVFCTIILTTKWGSFKEKILNEVIEIKNDFFLNKMSYFVHIAVFSFFTTIFWRLFSRTIIWKRTACILAFQTITETCHSICPISHLLFGAIISLLRTLLLPEKNSFIHSCQISYLPFFLNWVWILERYYSFPVYY